MPPHATAQQIGPRSHQCDATATRATDDGGRAYVLLDGIGSSDTVRAWTRAQARRLADLTARSLQPHEAITQVQEEITAQPGWQASAPGACAVAAVTGPDQLLRVAWIGDCRAYLLSPDGRLQRLTADHNQRAQFEAAGFPSPRWARNIVTRCLGHGAAGEALTPDWTAVHDRSGSRLLLASDGCYEPIEDAAHNLAAALGGGDPADRAEHLVRLALRLGGTDNATCMVVDFPPAGAPAASTSRVHCAHGSVLMQDGCPGCDAAEETPHPADPVRVHPVWARRALTRCRTCGQPPGRRIHRAA
ncbi:protein phosphatase 2C domain-containing protein (plasmid) [Kitasatospora sp. NBC_00374]|uniref:PP2C family protein-serine/threonine phosphatase n=1 Tax=Kitasatospora sp. NBC_00374 TaxID=2975964 RepID=UPI002F91327C